MFSTINRLKTDKDIATVLKKGQGRSGAFLRLKYIKNNLEHPRFAVVVSKKVHKSAVVRNRKKRQIREILRKMVKDSQLTDALDMVVFAQKPILDKDYKEIEVEMCGLLGVKLGKQ